MIGVIAFWAVLQPAAVAEAPPPEPAQHARLRSGYVSDADYPAASLRAREQGRTVIRITVQPNGRPADCRLWHTSGARRLDERACGIVLPRFRFTPARDAAGRAVAEWVALQFEWSLPGNIRLTGPTPHSQVQTGR